MTGRRLARAWQGAVWGTWRVVDYLLGVADRAVVRLLLSRRSRNRDGSPR